MNGCQRAMNNIKGLILKPISVSMFLKTFLEKIEFFP
jgi:hypothetical protein